MTMSGAASRENMFRHAGPAGACETASVPGWQASVACDRLLTLAARLTRTVAVARALTAAGRVVDLAGLEDGVGLLCAKTLDLDRPDARQILPALLELTAQIDGLRAYIVQSRREPQPAGRSAH